MRKAHRDQVAWPSVYTPAAANVSTVACPSARTSGFPTVVPPEVIDETIQPHRSGVRDVGDGRARAARRPAALLQRTDRPARAGGSEPQRERTRELAARRPLVLPELPQSQPHARRPLDRRRGPLPERHARRDAAPPGGPRPGERAPERDR